MHGLVAGEMDGLMVQGSPLWLQLGQLLGVVVVEGACQEISSHVILVGQLPARLTLQWLRG